ncbi:MAG TPA: hypothetical protein VMQ59_02740, partial [Acidimicrobiales bacterium]|nr:hypothetical protein [Acidimicrobiales bacterium]
IRGAGCESDTFATHHAFSAGAGAGSGDHGTYKGTKKLTMTWTAGAASGKVFKAKWKKSTGDYAGTYSGAGQSVSATLVPVATGGCAVVTTAPGSAAIGFGASDTDTATVTGQAGVTPTGAVHFYLCPGDTSPCTPTTPGVVDLGTDSVSGSGSTATATSSSYSPAASGGYCYLGVYSGDDHYVSASDGSTSDECFSVGAGTPTVTTKATTASITLGSSDTDTAKVTGAGGVTPTGSVHFYECAGATNPCTAASAANGGTDLGTATASGSGDVATATSAPFTASSTGAYCFLGVYSGDGHYLSASDGSTTDECFTVTAGTSELTTKPSSANISLGESESDTATVTGDGGVTPTGQITFYVCGPTRAPTFTACTNANESEVGSSVPLSGSGDVATATSASVSPPGIGDYCFLAVYPGDGHYAPASDGSTAAECFYVGSDGP